MPYILLRKDYTVSGNSVSFHPGFNPVKRFRAILRDVSEIALKMDSSVEWIAEVLSQNTMGVHLAPFQTPVTVILNEAGSMLSKNTALLRFIPFELQTAEHINYLVRATNLAGFGYVAPHLWTTELATQVCKTAAFKYIPKHMQTDAMATAAISSNGHLLAFVRSDLITSALCQTALLKSAGRALAYVPERTPELCKMAIELNGQNLLYLPKNEQTAEYVDLAVRRHPDSSLLNHIRPDLLTYEVCLAAIHRYPLDLKFIPKTLTQIQRNILWHAALVKDGSTLGIIPPSKRTLAICRIALENSPKAMKYIPFTKFIAEEREQLLDSVAPSGFEWIPAAYQTEARALRAVTEFSPEIIRKCRSADARTHAVFLAAVQRDGWLIRYIRAPERTLALCMAAVQNRGTSLQYIRERTPEMMHAAVQQDPRALLFITNAPEVLMAAVRRNGLHIQFVQTQTFDLMLAAIHQNPQAIQFIRNPPPEILKRLVLRGPEPLPRHVAEAVLLKAVADGEVCGITFEPIVVSDEFIVTGCGHVFKRDALETWIGMGNASCPTCKAQN